MVCDPVRQTEGRFHGSYYGRGLCKHINFEKYQSLQLGEAGPYVERHRIERHRGRVVGFIHATFIHPREYSSEGKVSYEQEKRYRKMTNHQNADL